MVSIVVVVGLVDLKVVKLVVSGMVISNFYGQIFCILVCQLDLVGYFGQFDVLVIISGGNKIFDCEIVVVFMNVGIGSGYIMVVNFGVVCGVFWSIVIDFYCLVVCSGVLVLSGGVVDGGYLVLSVFYDGLG